MFALAMVAAAGFTGWSDSVRGNTFGLTTVLGQDKGKAAGPVVKVERNQGDAATPEFKFKDVPSPAADNLARKSRVIVVWGDLDNNSGGIDTINDGKLPQQQDEPAANFFFDAGTEGGKLELDLGKAVAIKEVNTYSWHPNTRGPQVYKLYASDGTSKDFNPAPGPNTDMAKAGWKLLATVDTRPEGKGKGKGKGGMGGQYGVNIADPSGAAIGSYRYLLFDMVRTEDTDPFGNTFYSEITVIEKK
jgi:hypothetical protein